MFTAFCAMCAATVWAVAWVCKDNPRRQDTRQDDDNYYEEDDQ